MVFASNKQQLLAVGEWGPSPWESNGYDSGVKGWEAWLSFFYELLAAHSRDTMEIEPCVYPVSETKPKQCGPSIQQCCNFECLVFTVKVMPYHVFF